jgi:hypothetical protein
VRFHKGAKCIDLKHAVGGFVTALAACYLEASVERIEHDHSAAFSTGHSKIK